MLKFAPAAWSILVLLGAPASALPVVTNAVDNFGARMIVADATPGTQTGAQPDATGGGGAGTDIAAGHELFNATCSHCHGADAVQATKKINLRLLKQRYGDKTYDTFTNVVNNGRVSKGMPAWSAILAEADLTKIYQFLESVQETE